MRTNTNSKAVCSLWLSSLFVHDLQHRMQSHIRSGLRWRSVTKIKGDTFQLSRWTQSFKRRIKVRQRWGKVQIGRMHPVTESLEPTSPIIWTQSIILLKVRSQLLQTLKHLCWNNPGDITVTWSELIFQTWKYLSRATEVFISFFKFSTVYFQRSTALYIIKVFQFNV